MTIAENTQGARIVGAMLIIVLSVILFTVLKGFTAPVAADTTNNTAGERNLVGNYGIIFLVIGFIGAIALGFGPEIMGAIRK